MTNPILKLHCCPLKLVGMMHRRALLEWRSLPYFICRAESRVFVLLFRWWSHEVCSVVCALVACTTTVCSRERFVVRCLSVLNVHFCKKSPKLAQLTFDWYLSNPDIGRTFWGMLTPSNLYINLRSRDCLWVSVRSGVRPFVAVWSATRRFINLFWGSLKLGFHIRGKRKRHALCVIRQKWKNI